ncbi:uncharacterized protein LOC135707612 [Ochlerotatus camptorhynchus]|uniref:uncharacterized protein LOC135707612 n=1 Tax=Ochlerotatus camptorhynchus TaxID=644619 RepID=UPI0031E2C81B
MVNRRLKQFLESNGLLDERQHAFRQGHGSSTYFAALEKDMDTCVIKQLIGWDLEGHITHFVRNFLLDHTFQVTVGNTRSDPFPEETGVPQGSVIAVTLFLVAMNGVFSRFPKNVHVIVYADNILIADQDIAQAAVSAVKLPGSVYSGHVHGFTNGSRSRAGFGLGVAGLNTATSLSLPEECSVFSAEVTSILDAAITPADQPILVLTDSHSVIQALETEAPSHPWIQAITRFAPPSTVFTWIPGHCGVPGNEAADRLARSGASGPRYTRNVPLLDVRR